MNQLKTVLLLGLMSGLLIGIGSYLGRGYMPLFLIMAVLMNFVSYFWSDRIVLSVSGAREVSDAEAPRLHAIVHELALSAGIPKPRVYITPENQPNAFATGRDPKHGAIAVTQGILQLLDERELRGVLAHELGHIKNRDILVTTIAAMLGTAISYAAHMVGWFGIGGRGSDDGEGRNPFSALLMIILAPLAAMLIQMGISRSREYLADDSGAHLSGDPEALASALEKLQRGAQKIPANVEPATASLYIVNPFSGIGGMMSNLFSTHPPIEQRVARLRGMMYEQRSA